MKIKFNIVNCITSLLFSSLILCVNADSSNALNEELLGKDMPKFTTGRVETTKSFGGSGDEEIVDIAKTKDGGFIAIGYSSSTDAGFENKGKGDIIIIKYDSDLNEEWIRNYGGSESDYGCSLTELNDGSFVFIGFLASKDVSGFTVKGRGDVIMIKYNSDLNEEWIKTWGGSNVEEFVEVKPTADGGFVVAGFSDSVDAGFVNNGVAGKDDWIIIKYDKDGNQEWIENFGYSDKDFLHSMTITSDNKIVVSGDYYVNKVNYIVVRMYDMNGNVLWQDKFEDDYGFWTETTAIELLDKNILISGVETSMKYDTKGNRLWTKDYSLDYEDANIVGSISTSDNGYVLLVSSGPYSSGLREKTSIVKCDEYGNIEWSENFEGDLNDYALCMAIDSNSEIIFSMHSNSTDLGPGLENKGDYDAILVKYKLLTGEDLIVEQAEKTKTPVDIETARSLVNALKDSPYKSELQDRLNAINPELELERKTASANVDVYIKSENILMLSLDTNSVTFEDFSGIEDVEKINAVNITINSSLPYQLNAYLPTEIQNGDKTNAMDKQILNIKESSEADYKEFLNINEKIVLKDNCSAGNDLVHGIDIKLKGGIAYEKDIYKTTIKFEAEQK